MFGYVEKYFGKQQTKAKQVLRDPTTTYMDMKGLLQKRWIECEKGLIFKIVKGCEEAIHKLFDLTLIWIRGIKKSKHGWLTLELLLAFLFSVNAKNVFSFRGF